MWVTKYRYKVLTGDIAERVRALARETCEAFEIRIVRGVVSKDHVHILVSSPTTMAPSEIMRRLKGRTSSSLFEEFPHVRKRDWGQHFWAKGYFCATVGQLTEEMIQEGLEHHFEPRPNDDVRMEEEQDASLRRRVSGLPVRDTNPPSWRLLSHGRKSLLSPRGPSRRRESPPYSAAVPPFRRLRPRPSRSRMTRVSSRTRR